MKMKRICNILKNKNNPVSKVGQRKNQAKYLEKEIKILVINKQKSKKFLKSIIKMSQSKDKLKKAQVKGNQNM